MNLADENKELIRTIRYEIQQAQRPAKEVILDDEDVMKTLKISKRILQYLKSDRIIPFHKINNRSYYLLPDILDILTKNRTESICNEIKIK